MPSDITLSNAFGNDPFGLKRNGLDKLSGSMHFNPDGSVKNISGDYIKLLLSLAGPPEAGPQDAAIVQQNAEAQKLKGYADVLGANPPVTRPDFVPQPMPQRALPQFPREDRASVNPVAGALGLVAGAVVPDAAGQIQNSLLQGAQSAAHESMARRAQDYAMQADLASTVYQDQLNARNEANKYRLLNDERQFRNKELQREWKGEVGKLQVDAQVPNTISQGLTALNVKQKADIASNEQKQAITEGAKLNQAQDLTNAQVGYYGAHGEYMKAQAKETNELLPLRKDEALYRSQVEQHNVGIATAKEQQAKVEANHAEKMAQFDEAIKQAAAQGDQAKVAILKKDLATYDQRFQLDQQKARAEIGQMQAQSNLANANASLARSGLKFRVSAEAYNAAKILMSLGDEKANRTVQFYNAASQRLLKANADLKQVEGEYLGTVQGGKRVYARDTPGTFFSNPSEKDRAANMKSDPRWSAAVAEQQSAAQDMQSAEAQVKTAADLVQKLQVEAAKKTGVNILDLSSQPAGKKPGPKGAGGIGGKLPPGVSVIGGKR